MKTTPNEPVRSRGDGRATRWPAIARPRAVIGIVAGLAAFTATAALAFDHVGGTESARRGPEGVPVANGRILASPQQIVPGTTIDEIGRAHV